MLKRRMDLISTVVGKGKGALWDSIYVLPCIDMTRLKDALATNKTHLQATETSGFVATV